MTRRTALTGAPRSGRLLTGLAAGTAALAGLGLAIAASGSGATAGRTRTVVVARDSFSRSVAHGLGRAEIGEMWVVRQSRPVASRVSPHTGTSNVTVPPGTRTTATLPSTAALDADVTTTLTLPTTQRLGGGVYHTALARVQSDGSAYGGRVTVRTGGGWGVSLMKYVRGTESSLGSLTLPGQVHAGTTIRLEFAVSGTSPVSLRVRAWTTGAMPGWQLTRTDSSASRVTRAGDVGFSDYVSVLAAGAVTMAVTAFGATDTETVASAPSSSSAAPAPSAPSSSAPSSSAPSSSSPAPSAPSSSSQVPSSSSSGAPAPVEPARGSLDVGEAAYAVPVGALFVSPEGDDAAAGTEGAPLRTVARAVSLAKDGSTIVLRAGTYHESVTINARPGITIQNYPHEAVWFDGSVPVGNWTRQGSTWVSSGWTNQFDHGASFVRGSDAGGFVNPNYPMAPYPDQVFVDGTQLTQVASPSAVTAGTFAVDYAARTITIGSDPSGHAVRSTDLARALVVNSADRVTLRGVGVRNYGNSLPTGPAVYFGGTSGCRVQNVVFADIATQALGSSRSDLNVSHVTATRIGMLSISGTQADGMVVADSVVSRSNSEHFNSSPSAAAIKITRSRGVTVRNDDLSHNYDANGLWFDESVVGFTVVGNTMTDNGTRSDIQLELSDTGIVANNTLTGSDKGLFIFDTANVKVFNNYFAGNSRGSVFIMQDSRRETTPGGNHDPRQPIPDPTCTWVVKNITVSNNVFDWNGGQYGFQFYALDGQTNIPASDMNIVLNGNQFHVHAGSTDTMVGWGGSDNHTLTKIQSPADLNSTLHAAWTNTQIEANSQGRSALASGNPAVALPQDVAAAIGQAAGTRHLGTF